MLPFTYLGLLVGENPRSASTWQPAVDIIRKRLARWRGEVFIFWWKTCAFQVSFIQYSTLFLILFQASMKSSLHSSCYPEKLLVRRW